MWPLVYVLGHSHLWLYILFSEIKLYFQVQISDKVGCSIFVRHREAIPTGYELVTYCDREDGSGRQKHTTSRLHAATVRMAVGVSNILQAGYILRP